MACILTHASGECISRIFIRPFPTHVGVNRQAGQRCASCSAWVATRSRAAPICSTENPACINPNRVRNRAPTSGNFSIADWKGVSSGGKGCRLRSCLTLSCAECWRLVFGASCLTRETRWFIIIVVLSDSESQCPICVCRRRLPPGDSLFMPMLLEQKKRPPLPGARSVSPCLPAVRLCLLIDKKLR